MERIGDTETLCRLGDAGLDEPGIDPEERRRVLEVVGAGQAVVERGPRRYHTAAPPDLGALGGDLGVETEGADGTSVGVERAGDEAHDGGLACTVRSEEDGHGAAGDLEGQIGDRQDFPEGTSDTRERDGRAAIRCHIGVSARGGSG